MATLTYTNSRGQSVVMGDSPPLLVTGIDGLGGVQNDIHRQKAPGQDGFTVIGSILQARELVVEGVILDTDIYRYRRKLLQAFIPGKTGTLRFERGQVVREIECVPELAPAFPSDYSKHHQLFMLTLLCPSPFWLEPYEEGAEMASWIGGLRFPLRFPTTFAREGQEQIFINKGDAETPITVEFYGPATNPRLDNLTTGEFIRIKRDLLAGEKLVISTAFGNKSVRLVQGEAESNAMHWIDLDSVFWQLQPGGNRIKYNADAGVDKARVKVRWRNRYVGV